MGGTGIPRQAGPWRCCVRGDSIVTMTTEPLFSAGDHGVPVTVQTRTPLSPVDAFNGVVPIDLSQVFTGWGPFPGVRDVSNQTGPWDTVGQRRNPQLTDGSSALEKLTEYTAPHSFAYEITGFTGSLRFVVRGVRGEWTFAPDGGGTLIRWCYEFAPLPGRTWLLRRIIAPLWRRYMQQGIESSARVAEECAALR